MYPQTQIGKMAAHMAAALVAAVAFAAVNLLDPEMVRWVLVLVVAGNCAATVLAYLNVI